MTLSSHQPASFADSGAAGMTAATDDYIDVEFRDLDAAPAASLPAALAVIDPASIASAPTSLGSQAGDGFTPWTARRLEGAELEVLRASRDSHGAYPDDAERRRLLGLRDARRLSLSDFIAVAQLRGYCAPSFG